MAAALFAVSGCTPKPEMVRLSPAITVKTTETDHGSQPIGVAAFDVRPSQKLGIITDAHDHKVDISTSGDTAAALYESVTQALGRAGFKTKAMDSDDPATLRVELQELTLNSLKQPFDFATTLKVAVSAKARNGNDSYERTFTVNQRKPDGAPPSEDDANRMVNEALGIALSDMLADQELHALLSK
jgi:uncharacterized lipoprotein YajG